MIEHVNACVAVVNYVLTLTSAFPYPSWPLMGRGQAVNAVSSCCLSNFRS
jgi:hypothetical protein